jgi:hypothetical protein
MTEDKQDNSILQKEIDSWKEHFEYALREDNRLLFNQMLSEYQTEEDMLKLWTVKEKCSTESLVMSLILH